MRTIDVSLTLRQHDSLLVGSVNILGPEHELPSTFYSSGGGKDVVVAVTFIEFWSFDSRVLIAAVEDHDAAVEQPSAIGAHTADDQNALDSGAARRHGAHQVRAPVFVPQWTRIDPTLGFLDQQGVGPRSCGILSLDHIDPIVGIRIVDIELAMVIANRRRPDPVPVLRFVIHVDGTLLR